MLYKCGKRTHDFLGRFYFYFILVFYILGKFSSNDKSIIPLVFVGYEMAVPSHVQRALFE